MKSSTAHPMAKIKPQALLLQSKKKRTPSQISLSTIITCCVVVVLIGLSLYATYRHWYPRSNDEPGAGLKTFEHSKSFGESTGTGTDLPNHAATESNPDIHDQATSTGLTGGTTKNLA